jgi:hypothetical protein
LAGLTGAVFILFKAGYIRHDSHEITSTCGLLLLSLFLLAALMPRAKLLWVRIFPILALAACTDLAWYSYNSVLASNEAAAGNSITDFPARASTAAQWVVGKDVLERADLARRETLQSIPMPPVNGSVDVYPWGQQFVLARDMDYRPRPVFQSYLAFTTPLAQLNADFLAGPQAPDNILFDINAIDTRYPPPDLKDHPGLRKAVINLPVTSQPSVLILQSVLSPSKITSDNCWSDLEFR